MRTKAEYQREIDKLKNSNMNSVSYDEWGNESKNYLGDYYSKPLSILQELIDNLKENE